MDSKLVTGLALAIAALPVAAAAQVTQTAQDAIPARGVFKSGEQVYVDCIATDAAAIARCDWFLMGAHDMATYYQDTDQIEAAFCVPQHVNIETLRKVAVDRWRDQPDSRKFSAVSSLLNALSDKYPGPCTK